MNVDGSLKWCEARGCIVPDVIYFVNVFSMTVDGLNPDALY